MSAKFLNKCSENIQNLIFPSFCILCEQASDTHIALCKDCQAALPKITSACFQCGLPINADEPQDHCGKCMSAPAQACDSMNSLWVYQGFIREWIIQAKFFRGRHLLKPLSQVFAQAILQRHPSTNGVCFVPVPLHASRQRQRGFNQCFEIARFLKKETGIPIRKELVKKNKATLAQAGLSLRRRQKNVQDAFSLQIGPMEKTCLIIDDVITSGQTIESLATVLKSAGAKRVEAWSLARTIQTLTS